MLNNPIIDPKLIYVDFDDFNTNKYNELQSKHVPFIITNSTKQWINKRWDLTRLIHDFGHCKLKIGENDKGKTIKVSLINYMNYAIHNKDDSPLYVFNNKFDKRVSESGNKFNEQLKSQKNIDVQFSKKYYCKHILNDLKVLPPFVNQD